MTFWTLVWLRLDCMFHSSYFFQETKSSSSALFVFLDWDAKFESFAQISEGRKNWTLWWLNVVLGRDSVCSVCSRSWRKECFSDHDPISNIGVLLRTKVVSKEPSLWQRHKCHYTHVFQSNESGCWFFERFLVAVGPDASRGPLNHDGVSFLQHMLYGDEAAE